ncbi:MAG: hypothetical protein ACFB3T_16105 [Geminicoccaceae bacterium]
MTRRCAVLPILALAMGLLPGEVRASAETLPPIPQVIACSGNEPFWSLEIDGAIGRYNALGADGIERWPDTIGERSELNYLAKPALVWRGRPADADRDMVAFAYAEACVDTMADGPANPITLILSLPGGRTVQGCCAHAL